MDVRSLRYFLETVKLKSFTRAAETLGVTQSTISKMIRQMEVELGETLLIRGSRGLRLTDTGRVVNERGRDVLAAMARLTQEIDDTRSRRRGELRLGIPPMINVMFTRTLMQFCQKYPEIALHLREGSGQEIERLVAAGELEIGLTASPVDADLGLSEDAVAGFRVWALGVPSLLRIGADGAVRLAALKGTPLVLLNDDFALTRLLRRAFLAAGLEPRVAAQSGHWDWTLAMARAGMGVALLPEHLVTEAAKAGLAAAPLRDPEVVWQVVHVRRGDYLSYAAEAWLDTCRTSRLKA